MRTFDASVVNRIVNDNPDIAAAITHDPSKGLFDAQELLGAVYSFILMDNREDGAALFEWSSPNVWQSHTVFDHTCRGAHAIEAAKRMVKEMFTVWDAKELWGQTPIANRAARLFNRKIGARASGMGEHWAVGEVEYFTIEREGWLAHYAK